ncbi:MAG: carboxylating nicotinate-nucleotide diphosphorylase [bacterium]|nr:carboxylating nicotinate-nucleotide diphosphorylase [bacterium]
MFKNLEGLVRKALLEDVGQEDVTTNMTVPEDAVCEARLVAKQDGVLSGMEVFRTVFDELHTHVTDWASMADGDAFEKGHEVAAFKGKARQVLTGERVALNFVQRLSGVATLTSQFVEELKGVDARVCDTRKTTPLMRQLEKEAVIHGGGANHRHTLFNGILIKENHIVAAGGLTNAVKRAIENSHHLMKVEVEVTDLGEFDEAVEAGADVIMLDNMSLDDMREAVKRAEGLRVTLEASGNVTLDRIRSIAETGVHFISVGALTHSAPAVDLSLLIENA